MFLSTGYNTTLICPGLADTNPEAMIVPIIRTRIPITIHVIGIVVVFLSNNKFLIS